MITFKDKTYCSSPHCINECGRKMTEEERKQLREMALKGPNFCIPVSYGYFCGEPKKNERI